MFKLHRIVWALMAVASLARWSAGQAATQSVPTGLVDPIAMVALDPTGNFKYLSINSLGSLVDGNGIGQTASGPFGFVAPVAPVAIDPSGNWQFLHIDVNGNLMTLVGANSGGSTTGGGGTGAAAAPFTGGTLTSALYLSGNPTTALQAADKAYVDQQIATVLFSSNPTFQNIAASQLTLSGNVAAATGTISGLLTVGSITVANVTLTNTLSGVTGSFSGAMTVGGLGTFNTLAATAISVPSVIYAGSGAFVFGGNPQTADLTSSTFTYPVAYWGPGQVFTTMDTSKSLRHMGDALTINGGAVPISAPCLGSNSSGQPISGTCSGGGGGATYPTGSGIPIVVGGASWGTTLTPPASAIVGISDSQTLTNKAIAPGEITGETFPASGIMVGTTDTQTLTNKSIASTEITGLPTFPGSTIVGISDTQTLTNKSIAALELTSGNLLMARMPTIASDQYLGTTSGTAVSGINLPNCNTNFALTYTTGGGGFGCITISPYNTFTVVLAEEFLGGQQALSGNIGSLGWSTSTIGGTGATIAQASDAVHPGQAQIATAATSGTGSEMYLGANGTMQLGAGASGNLQTSWIFKLNNVTSGAYRIGFMNTFGSTAIPATAGYYLRYDVSKSDTSFMACVDNSGTESCTTIGGTTPVVGQWYTFHMTETAAGSVNYVVNGPNDTGVASGGTQGLCITGGTCGHIVTFPTAFTVPGVTVAATTSAVAQMNIDYFQLIQTLPR